MSSSFTQQPPKTADRKRIEADMPVFFVEKRSVGSKGERTRFIIRRGTVLGWENRFVADRQVKLHLAGERERVMSSCGLYATEASARRHIVTQVRRTLVETAKALRDAKASLWRRRYRHSELSYDVRRIERATAGREFTISSRHYD